MSTQIRRTAMCHKRCWYNACKDRMQIHHPLSPNWALVLPKRATLRVYFPTKAAPFRRRTSLCPGTLGRCMPFRTFNIIGSLKPPYKSNHKKNWNRAWTHMNPYHYKIKHNQTLSILEELAQRCTELEPTWTYTTIKSYKIKPYQTHSNTIGEDALLIPFNPF